MKPIGYLLLWIGFVAAAFVSLQRLEVPNAKWSTISWGSYAAAVAVCVAGLVLLRLGSRQTGGASASTTAELSQAGESLDEILRVIDPMCRNKRRSPTEVLSCIDGSCAVPLAEFAAARHAIARRYGLDQYASVMTEFASAERYLNRSWSAAADGYVDEVESALGRAQAHFQQAKNLLTSAGH